MNVADGTCPRPEHLSLGSTVALTGAAARWVYLLGVMADATMPIRGLVRARKKQLGAHGRFVGDCLRV